MLLICYNKALKLSLLSRILNDNDLYPFFFDGIPIEVWYGSMTLQDKQSVFRTLQNRDPIATEIINIWYKFAKASGYIDLEKEAILMSPLFYNSHVKTRGTMVRWPYLAQHGITHLHIYDQSSNVSYDCKYLNENYNVKLNFITYQKILSAIPKEWYDILRNNICPSINDPLRYISGLLSQKRIVKSKNFYKLLASKYYQEAIDLQIHFEIDLDNFSISRYTIFSNIYKDTKNVDVRYFMFKLVHNRLTSGADPGFDRGGPQIVTGLKLPFWGLSFVEFWCWGLIFGGQEGPGPPGPPWICP